jgi:hypothetical protein
MPRAARRGTRGCVDRSPESAIQNQPWAYRIENQELIPPLIAQYTPRTLMYIGHAQMRTGHSHVTPDGISSR